MRSTLLNPLVLPLALLLAASVDARADQALRRESREPVEPPAASVQPTKSSEPPELTRDQFEAQLDIDTLKGHPYGKLVLKEGGTVKLRAEDVLWMARMIEGEAGRVDNRGHAEAIIWTVAQRGAYLKQFPKKSFRKYMQEFSQVIDPTWLAGGSACPHGKVSMMCTPERTKERRAQMAKPWGQIHPNARRVALLFATGRLDNPVPGSIDFAASFARLRPPMRPDFRYTFGAGTNVFWRDYGEARTDLWTGMEIRVQGSDGAKSNISLEASLATLDRINQQTLKLTEELACKTREQPKKRKTAKPSTRAPSKASE